MNFSLWNFKDWFLQNNIDLTYRISNTDCRISALTLAASNLNVPADTACICEGILAGHPQYRSMMFQNRDVLLFPTADPVDIINTGNAMIEYYSNWEDSLYDRILSGGSISDLLDLSADILPFPLAVVSTDQGVLASSASWKLPLTKEYYIQLEKHSVSADHTPVFASLRQEKNQNLLFSPLQIQERKIGYLVAYEKDGRFKPSDTNLFQLLSKAVENCCQTVRQSKNSSRILDDFFLEALTRSNVHTQQLQKILKNLDWPDSNFFTVFCIEADHTITPYQKKSLLEKLKEYFFYSGSFLYEKHIILITYTSLSAVSDIRKPLCHLASPQHYVIGQALPTNDIYCIREFYQQSVLAVQYARSAGKSFLALETVLHETIFSSASENIYIQTFAHPDLNILMNTDRTGHDHLLLTLYYYLILGQNNTNTAEILYIHRNTLRHRLDKIKSLIHSDLNDPTDVSQLLASYLIFDPGVSD